MMEANFSSLKVKKISCIINPQGANKKWKRTNKFRNYLKKNFPCKIVDDLKDKSQTIEISRNLCSNNELIVAAGGDGTIADVIQGIMESGRQKDVVFGVLPLGSGNAFCKSLRIPNNMIKSLHLIAKGRTKKIDIIDIEGKKATFSSIGATAEVTLEKLRHSIPGLIGHLLASWKMLFTPKKEMKFVLIDGVDDSGERFQKKALSLKVFDCVIGKTNYFGYNWKAAPEAKINDGFIDITLFETSGLRYLLCFPFIYLGIFQKTQKHFKAKKVIIRGEKLPVQYNGESLGEKDEIKLRVLPQAINIIIP